MRALGLVKQLIRDGKTVFEAVYQPSYRHTARRVCGPRDLMWSSQNDAVRALKHTAHNDGVSIDIEVRS